MSWTSSIKKSPFYKYNPMTAPVQIFDYGKSSGAFGGESDSDKQARKSKEAQDQAAARLESLGEKTFGQSEGQTGSDIQDIKSLQKGRIGQNEPVSESIRNQKQGAMATAQRSLASSGVKGGVASGAADQIGRQRDMDIAASLYGQQRTSTEDYRDLIGNIASGTTGMAMTAEQMKLAQNQPKQKGLMEGLFS